MDALQEMIYTVDDIYALPEGRRAELIDGRIYDMAPPNTRHQEISGGLYYKIRNYIEHHRGNCRVFPAPFAVFLNKDSRNYVEPDISVVCDADKIDERGCNGAPDWIIEIISPGTERRDYGVKLFKYRSAGVREYWIVNPKTHVVNVFDFEHEDENENVSAQYGFDDEIPVCIYSDLHIRILDVI